MHTNQNFRLKIYSKLLILLMKKLLVSSVSSVQSSQAWMNTSPSVLGFLTSSPIFTCEDELQSSVETQHIQHLILIKGKVFLPSTILALLSVCCFFFFLMIQTVGFCCTKAPFILSENWFQFYSQLLKVMCPPC